MIPGRDARDQVTLLMSVARRTRSRHAGSGRGLFDFNRNITTIHPSRKLSMSPQGKRFAHKDIDLIPKNYPKKVILLERKVEKISHVFGLLFYNLMDK